MSIYKNVHNKKKLFSLQLFSLASTPSVGIHRLRGARRSLKINCTVRRLRFGAMLMNHHLLYGGHDGNVRIQRVQIYETLGARTNHSSVSTVLFICR